jgi:hypothetical protein
MAECFWPGVTQLLLQDAGRRARQVAERLSSEGASTRYVGSILVPADEVAFCLFEAASIEAATEANQRSEIPFERILEVVRLEPR